MLKMDINISPKQLENKNFISKLKNEIDDFVTGYLPLSYLKLFPYEHLLNLGVLFVKNKI